MACSPAPGFSLRHLKDNHLSSHPLDSTWQGLTRLVTFHEVSTCSEEIFEKRERAEKKERDICEKREMNVKESE